MVYQQSVVPAMSSIQCSKCAKVINEGKYLTVGHQHFHPSCFQCDHCKRSIGGNYVEHGDRKRPFHPECVEKVLEEEATKKGNICKKCRKACCHGKYISLQDGTLYHAQCFQCLDCGVVISGSYISYGEERIPLHAECGRKRDVAKARAAGKICRKCKKVCFEGRIMTVSDGEVYHAACFTCTHCKKTIDTTYAQHGPEDLPYHLSCLETMRDKVAPSSSSSKKANATSASDSKGSKASDAPRMCKKCKLVCDVGKFYRTKSNEVYHTDCFCCSDPSCNGVITGTYTEHGEPPLPYHPACGKELFAPRCCLCTHTLEGQFYKHPFFESEMYCMSHESLPSCFACARKQPLPASRREGFADLMDGRSLCAQCSGSIIVDSSEAVALYKGIVEFMGRDLGLTIPPGMRDVPILLVDFQSLNENRNKLGEVLGYHADAQAQATSVDSTPSTSPSKMPAVKPATVSAPPPPALLTPVRRAALGQQHTEGIIRGVTMSTCSQVRYLPSAGLQFDAAGKGLAARLSTPEVYQMKQVRDVTAVLVLYGLPKDLTASILAHEAMHVWLKLNKKFPFRMAPKLEEGLCQVIAHKYLEHLVARAAAEMAENTAPVAVSSSAKVSRSPSAASLAPPSAPIRSNPAKRPTSVSLKPKSKPKDKTLTKWFSEQIEVDKSPIYGKGFEEAHRAVSVLGLPAVLSYIQRHQCLPPLHK